MTQPTPSDDLSQPTQPSWTLPVKSLHSKVGKDKLKFSVSDLPIVPPEVGQTRIWVQNPHNLLAYTTQQLHGSWLGTEVIQSWHFFVQKKPFQWLKQWKVIQYLARTPLPPLPRPSGLRLWPIGPCPGHRVFVLGMTRLEISQCWQVCSLLRAAQWWFHCTIITYYSSL